MQPVGTFPCRYHDRDSFNAILNVLTEVIERAGGWPAFLAGHDHARG